METPTARVSVSDGFSSLLFRTAGRSNFSLILCLPRRQHSCLRRPRESLEDVKKALPCRRISGIRITLSWRSIRIQYSGFFIVSLC